MGLLDSLFGGNGASSTSRQETKVSTITTTDIGSIGLTGEAAVALATIIEEGSLERAEITAAALTDLAGFFEDREKQQILTADIIGMVKTGLPFMFIGAALTLLWSR